MFLEVAVFIAITYQFTTQSKTYPAGSNEDLQGVQPCLIIV